MIDNEKTGDDTAEQLREETAAEAPELAEHDALQQLRDDLASMRQELLYARAETENVRRRMAREADDVRSYAVSTFARDILSVADNVARALDAIPQELREDERFKGLVAGLEATGRELDSVFRKHGVERVAAMGLPLDPNLHEAMLEVPTPDAPVGTVVQEMQPGYTIKGRLLRPARVAVARPPA